MNDWYHDLHILGSPVTVIRTLMNGDTVKERLSALLAVDSVLTDERNGVEFKSARVSFGYLIDVWGSSP